MSLVAVVMVGPHTHLVPTRGRFNHHLKDTFWCPCAPQAIGTVEEHKTVLTIQHVDRLNVRVYEPE